MERPPSDSASRILTINSGSSSVKFSLYLMGRKEEALLLSGIISGIGQGAGRFHAQDTGGVPLLDLACSLAAHDDAFRLFFEWFHSRPEGKGLAAVGHRLVHGGSAYSKPHLINAELLSALDELVPFAPDHLPHEIAAIQAFEHFCPGMMQVACFDTAFHRTMPEVARLYALPEEIRRRGIMRYGFHGLSYEYILGQLRRETGPETADGRVIIAHLGNGASMGAFVNSKSVDTTMGFTPAGGLVMSTRSGDLDPGVIVYLLRDMGMGASAVNCLINKQAGLLGVSGTSSDMKTLLDAEGTDLRAAQAVSLFCYQAKKFVGALSAALGGLDTLIFTGGIGENAPLVRARICEGLSYLGVRIDRDRNLENASILSPGGSPVAVRVMKTNEELMIARHTHALIRQRRQP